MTRLRLVLAGLRFHWRSHLGVFLGATLAVAIITGALAVGDSVRYSLRKIALSRLGSIDLVLHNPTRFFRTRLEDDLATDLRTETAAVIVLRGTAIGEKADGTSSERRTGQVRVVGVTEPFWHLGKTPQPSLLKDGEPGCALNERLARALGVAVGDEVVLRVDKPSLLSRDAPLSTIEDATVTLRLPVTAIQTEAQFGHFSPEANQIPPFNAFVARETLQKLVGTEGRANMLLIGQRAGKSVEASEATGALWKRWEFTDSGLELRTLRKQNAAELRTTRVFLDPAVAEAARKATVGAQGILTYFVNELRVGGRATPYSTVSALQGDLVPAGMADDETIINDWLAKDLGARVGDSLRLTYWLVGPMRRLEEKTSAFRIRAILPMERASDPELMPDIPGLSDKKDCRDWEPGVPVDLNRIRDKDQAYWDRYRGSPKAFITLRAGQKIWNNRFGDLTAVRYPAARSGTLQNVEACLRQALNPASQGLFFAPVRERAFKASDQSLDFGQLFLGFSLFLIVAALLLTALLFALGTEQRAEEVGTLLAVGWRPGQVRNLLLAEAATLALAAGIAGACLATIYTRLVVEGLATIWQGAVAEATLSYRTTPETLIVGCLSGVVISLLSIYPVLRRQAKAPVREVLASGAESETRLFATGNRRRGAGLPTAAICLVLALGMLAMTGQAGEGEGKAGLFFGAGAMLLIAGIAACRFFLGKAAAGNRFSVNGLGLRNNGRRLGRSLSAIALLASGAFLVIAVGANRHDPATDAGRRSSGTGGFALYGEASLPVYQNLNTAEGREAFDLKATEMVGTTVVPLRLREGDEASCLNLNRAQTPRLLGIDPRELQTRKAFTFTETAEKTDDPWMLLDRTDTSGAVPVVGDQNTIVWSLGKKLGDTLPYTDDRGNTHQLRIVGILANSVLQGGLVLSETRFLDLFPSHSGYQVFLIDTPAQNAKSVSKALTNGSEAVGLSLTPTVERLAAFNTVENTYLSIFAVLGGLGLALGSLGLGIIVLRNVWERRSELALLQAVGWPTAMIYRLLFGEHALLLVLGLTVGIAAALIAVLPSLGAPGADVPYLSLSLTLIGVFFSGFLFTALATAIALRSRLHAALRNE